MVNESPCTGAAKAVLAAGDLIRNLSRIDQISSLSMISFVCFQSPVFLFGKRHGKSDVFFQSKRIQKIVVLEHKAEIVLRKSAI